MYMEEKLYFISEVSKMVGVEPHVLRYWEEELELTILRNGQGKRCYTQQDVEQLCRIKYWKDKGMQLRAVKEVMDGESPEDSDWRVKGDDVRNRESSNNMDPKHPEEDFVDSSAADFGEDTERIPKDLMIIEDSSDSMKRFEQILDGIMEQALERNNEKLIREICDVILQELDEKLEARMEELLQQELLREMVQEGERESAASSSGRKAKESIWKRWKQWLERYISI